MRDREEILKAFEKKSFHYNSKEVLEVLLDMRDLLYNISKSFETIAYHLSKR